MAKHLQLAVRRATPEQRVRALLACRLFTPWIRKATLRSLIDDPETRTLTRQLADPAELNSALEIKHSAFDP